MVFRMKSGNTWWGGNRGMDFRFMSMESMKSMERGRVAQGLEARSHSSNCKEGGGRESRRL